MLQKDAGFVILDPHSKCEGNSQQPKRLLCVRPCEKFPSRSVPHTAFGPSGVGKTAVVAWPKLQEP